jgi:Iron-containing redox enzyme
MHTLAVAPEISNESTLAATKTRIEQAIDNVMGSLPKPDQLSSEERRGMIARYTSVLEGNFIYWMTAAYLSVQSEEARPIIIDNLLEEVRDSHPAMLRRFAIAASAMPTKEDALAINDELTKARLFFGKLQGVQTLVAMAFFEGFIQKFMAYLADLAVAQGSTEMEYTDVHGVCDIAHTEGLIQALSTEMVLSPIGPDADVLEGVELLEALMHRVAYGKNSAIAA